MLRRKTFSHSLGHRGTFRYVRIVSANTAITDIPDDCRNFAFVPTSGHDASREVDPSHSPTPVPTANSSGAFIDVEGDREVVPAENRNLRGQAGFGR